MCSAFAVAHEPKAGELPVSLRANPYLDAWLGFAADGRVDVYTGKVELGQGIVTALAQIAADELQVDLAAIRMHAATTGRGPNESMTSGSLSVQHSGLALRAACAYARVLCLRAVARECGRDPASVSLRDGRFICAGRDCGGYGQLARRIDLHVPVELVGPEWMSTRRAYVGVSSKPIGLQQKVEGAYPYIHDMVLDGMVHGRVLRPPAPGAVLGPLDLAAWRAQPGVLAVVRDGSLLGVVAEQEYLAERVLGRIAAAADWSRQPALPPQARLDSWLREQPCRTVRWSRRPGAAAVEQGAGHAPAASARGAAASGPRPAPGPGTRLYAGDFFKPYIKHASIGPSCAWALTRDDGSMQVWSHTQGIHNLKADLCLALGVDTGRLEVTHVPGSGCYGHNGADDAAYDAAWLSRHVPGRPLKLQWSRADELNWSPMGPAMAMRIEAEVDENARVLDWRHTVWGPGHSLRPGRADTPTLLGSWYTARPSPARPAVNAPAAAGGGADRNIVPLYDFPCSALVCHRVDGLPLRASAQRALGAFGNVYAIEAMVDDIALAHGLDPLQFRLDNLSDPRAAAVLRKACEMARWHERGQAAPDTGLGLGFARYKTQGAYCAVVARVEVTHELRVRHLYIAVDVGEVINPEGVVQQIEGGAIQATSWALYEEAHFDAYGLVDGDWESYPILRFSQVPEVSVEILPGNGHPPVGAGEPSLGPAAAAIGNALRAALGVRVRSLPLTPDAIARAIQDEPGL
ncbi:xanthine dehydrogenase family protein molybdopterin-binding subunit [Candidimonas nitroreducens]|nr:molybdopterin cofactor-binding domain-containing protein [Candidimonas nitroreducens]